MLHVGGRLACLLYTEVLYDKLGLGRFFVCFV